MMRALLVFNPEATRVSGRVRDVIAHALGAQLKLDVAGTTHRHHATELAVGAVRDGYDLVAALGGDGTVNEVANGLAGTDVTLMPIPAGGTNVFARTLGLPRDAVEATSVLLERLDRGAPTRRINLGRVNGRVFTFCAGIGVNAAVVEAVERRAHLKKRIGESYFVAQALRRFLLVPRRNPPVTLHIGGATYPGIHEVAVGNSDPFTFLGARPFRVTPDARHDLGLDVAALSSVRTATVLRIVLRAFGDADHAAMRQVRSLHDLDAFLVESVRPLPCQVDGDYVGEDTRYTFDTVRDALSIFA